MCVRICMNIEHCTSLLRLPKRKNIGERLRWYDSMATLKKEALSLSHTLLGLSVISRKTIKEDSNNEKWFTTTFQNCQPKVSKSPPFSFLLGLLHTNSPHSFFYSSSGGPRHDRILDLRQLAPRVQKENWAFFGMTCRGKLFLHMQGL